MNIYLAPIRGITDIGFRNCFSKYFNNKLTAIAPFYKTNQSKKYDKNYLKDLIIEDNEMKVIPQVLSKSSDEVLRSIESLELMGHKSINLNLGCSYPMVAKKKMGSGMLQYPELMNEYFGNILKNTDMKVSLKMRPAYSSLSEIDNYYSIINEHRFDFVCIHPRKGTQLYEGEASLEMFNLLGNKLKHRLVYNGDIYSKSDFDYISSKLHNLHGVMLGRGVIQNPFLGELILSKNEYKLSETEFRDRFSAFHKEIFMHYGHTLSGKGHILQKMNSFWVYFADSFCGADKELKKLKKVKTLDDYIKIAENILKEANLESSILKFIKI